MAEPINLRRARKARARDEKRKAADQNAALHGRSKGQRSLQEAEKAAVVRVLDHAKRDRDDS